MIEPGQNESVTLTFTAEDMASYDYTGVKAKGGSYVLEAGKYTISLRSDSHTVIDSRTLTIDKDRIYNDSNDAPALLTMSQQPISLTMLLLANAQAM